LRAIALAGFLGVDNLPLVPISTMLKLGKMAEKHLRQI
jgi:hypothetical protein